MCNQLFVEMLIKKNVALYSCWSMLNFLHVIYHVNSFGILSKSDIMKCERYTSSTISKDSIRNCNNKILTTITITNENRVIFMIILVQYFHNRLRKKQKSYASML